MIKTIAGNEMRTLLRSWFFRIFALLAIVGLSFFNLAMNLQISGAPWIYRALASSIPYANLIILNLGQAIVAVFLSSEFLKQDKKNDTIEVIYARSMSNSDYIFGKTLGILAVFFILNLIVLSIAIGFSFFNNETSRNAFSFLIYPLLISLPTLVYILGLSFFLMILIKNQAVTFIILLGYIALTVFYLSAKVFHLFDFIAYQVPMMHSSVGGFGNMSEILLHRSIYLVAGIGFIFLTIHLLPRLPQSRRFNNLPFVLAVLFISSSAFLMYRYYQWKENRHLFKQQIITLNDKYVDFPRVKVLRCDLDLIHKSNIIEVKASLNIINQCQHPIDTILFTLNPSLKISSVLVNGKLSLIKRNKHFVFIPYPAQLLHGDTLNVLLNYEGEIDEDVCFIDRAIENIEDNFRFELFNIRKRFAFLQDNFVCLTSDALWYPTSGEGYSSIRPFAYFPDFTKFTLKVKTLPGLTVISQGAVVYNNKGYSYFKPEYPLPKICLLIGAYHSYRVQVDSITYTLYTFDKNQYYKPYFNELGDTIKGLLKDIKKEYEVHVNRTYPYNQFMLAEVPVHFALDKHVWALTSEAVQPEMVLYPEKGVFFKSSDFKRIKYRNERDNKRNNDATNPKSAQAQMFKQLIHDNILAKANDWQAFHQLTDYNTFNLFPQYVTFISQLNSNEWPVLNLAIQAYLNDRFTEVGNSFPTIYDDLTNDEKIILQLQKTSLEKLINVKTPKERKNQSEIKRVLLAKGSQLFNLLGAQYGQNKIDSILNTLIIRNICASFSFGDLNNALKNSLGESKENYIKCWYNDNTLPGILLKDIETYKVVEDNVSKYQIRFKIANPEPVDGLINISIELNDPNRKKKHEWWNRQIESDFSKKIYLPSNSAFEIGLVFGTEPVRMSIFTYLSQNLPNNLMTSFSGFNDTRKIPFFESVVSCPLFSTLVGKGEIIIDNEDKGFSFQQTENKAFLKSIIKKKKDEFNGFSRFWSWNPPETWEPILESQFFGKYTHSARYTKGGMGNHKAIWSTALKKKGVYEISFYLHKVEANMDWQRTNRKTDYNFNVYHDGGVEKITLSTDEIEDGWNSLGTFYISTDTAKVELSNKSTGNIIYADAIKWTISK